MVVITLSHEAHSGTRDLARLLAERLGYRYVSRDELTQAVAARCGLERNPQTAESEGRALSLWEQLGEQLSGERGTYQAALKAVVSDLALADNVVLVGHGAGQFLRDLRTVVRVFVVAPMEDRVARLMAEGVADADRARHLIEQQDRESADYLRYLFGIDWVDPHQWDLVINTGRASITAALDMLAGYAGALVRDQAEQEALARLQLASRIEEVLLRDADLGVSRLSVRLEGGALVLEGEALAQQDRERAEATARSLARGVTLDNRIVLRPPTSV